MYDSFRIGEVAKIVNLPTILEELNGIEVLITGPLEVRYVRNIYGEMVHAPTYICEYNGTSAPVHPMFLKKRDEDKKPDASLRETPVRWEDCAWQPRQLEEA